MSCQLTEVAELMEGTDPHFSTRKADYDPAKRVKVRILSDGPFPVDWQTGFRRWENGLSAPKQDRRSEMTSSGGGLFSCVSGGLRKSKKEFYPQVKKVPAIILHFHGGGFIAMSSASHQNYTRKWAKATGCPVFSVDYRLSPKFVFPDALNDCWQVYFWLV